jgi:putative hemolysin
MRDELQKNLIELPWPSSGLASQRLFSGVKHLIEKCLALNFVNRKYLEAAASLENVTFFDRVLEILEVKYDLDAGDLMHIPDKGAVVVVANHPFGALEGLIMASILFRKRIDFKIIANYLLGLIPEIREQLLLVDPFAGGPKIIRNNGTALRSAYKWLGHGNVLGVFPAGEVSHLRVPEMTVSDPQWNASIARIIRKTQAIVVPMYFKGCNGPLFQLAGILHPRMRTLLLPHAFARRSGSSVEVKIGQPISPERLKCFPSDQKIITYLRHRTYLLSRRRSINENDCQASNDSPLKPPLSKVHPDQLILEQKSLTAEQKIIENEDFCVYLAEARHIPKLLHEIGRLREIAFRQAGEGTGRDIDLDIFDAHYLHLFLWDRHRHRIAGAYRMGRADVILDTIGIKGLYTSTLFRYRAGFCENILPALELGRSFLCRDYQKSYAPLLLLWKGIGKFVIKNPQYRILFGPVSIDNHYQDVSRRLIVRFFENNNHLHELSSLVRPRNPFSNRKLFRFGESILNLYSASIEELSEIVSEIDTHKTGVPVLLRQYLKLGGKMLGFNLDPGFSNVLDCLVMVDLLRAEPRMLNRYLGREGCLSFTGYHARQNRACSKTMVGMA